ncbi:AraC family transcriptional regulator [Pseudomonas sp. ABC1]|uniref:helix-turn-helix transcriptional regulator n=1 Tax=Pseudomonas sp. ABC1 TaxID=2748080 RepID=UPI0015C34618|nr:AraC family transcriptional regulator [Pseudomonas sp. ABC1]QLF92617.1 AraC family transcriptional regulator [Pseudomonas sp. ABC1]
MQDTAPTTIDLAIRSYGRDSHAHSHAFAQLVLPLSGSLEIDIEGQGARLDRMRAACVPAGLRHAQESQYANRSLIVDVPVQGLDAQARERLSARGFLPVTPAAAHLIGYMSAALANDSATRRTDLWTPLLLDALFETPARPASRLASLLAQAEAAPFGWSVADMAVRAGMSTSRLHALFRQELDTTPHAWLSERRLECVCQWLLGSDLPIAEIAYRAGFSDQSALTRALRKHCGMTPAQYRRQARH